MGDFSRPRKIRDSSRESAGFDCKGFFLSAPLVRVLAFTTRATSSGTDASFRELNMKLGRLHVEHDKLAKWVTESFLAGH